ncbi:hypothetical protein SRIMM317S_01947 [Streptomyces rimosus subsp. rimosus]
MAVPAATAAAEPPLEPPGMCSGDQALRVCGVVSPYANSWVWVLPVSTAPAARSRSVTAASASGTWSARTRELAVVGTPATSIRSFSATGTPCSGPRGRPAAISRSASAADRSAASRATDT